MKIRLFILLALIIGNINTYAGTGYYLTICNFTKKTVRIELSKSVNWQPGDLQASREIPAGDTLKLYTESKADFKGRVIINAYEVSSPSSKAYLGSAELWQSTYPTIASYNISSSLASYGGQKSAPNKYECSIGTNATNMLTVMYTDTKGFLGTAYPYLIFVPNF